MGLIGIYAYGSLLADPGGLAPHIVDRRPMESPWPIEYARSSSGRGGAPTLTIHMRGAPVLGQLLVLNDGVSLQVARELLWERENRPLRKAIREHALTGFGQVLYCSLDANIPDEELTGDHLADLAIRSVGPAGARNGIRYLATCIRQGIVTPLTEPYRAAILKKSAAPTLEEAEESLRRSASRAS